MRQMTLTHRYLPGTTIVRIGGELDALTATELDAFLHQAVRAGDDLVFDLADLTFLDSTGLEVMLAHCERTRRHGGTPALTDLQRSPARVIAITGVASAAAVYSTVEQALDDTRVVLG